MAKTLTQKILEGQLVAGAYEPGDEIGIRIDQTLTQDATGMMACLQFEAMGVDRVATDRSVSSTTTWTRSGSNRACTIIPGRISPI